jgi:ribonuclease D
MKRFENPDYCYLNKKEELFSYLESLEDKKCYMVALDIEAELNLHAYGETLCLIQIFDGTDRIIIDPLEIDNTGLKTLFENRNILKIMYDASSDSSLLKNAYDIDMKSVLDLRPAVELLIYEKNDLHSIIASELAITLTRKTKFQRHNWMRRPIDKEAIEYALNDVIYLFKLKDALLSKLYARNLLDMFILKNLQVQNKDYARSPMDKYLKMKGYHSLTRDEKNIFRKIFDVREKYAKISNMPAYYVIKREDLIEIARDSRYIDEIRFPNRFSSDFVQRILTELKNVSK